MAKRVLPVVQTAGLCKTFNDFWLRPRVEAVKDLNLEIRPGEVFGLLGPNGSGKTTTIKMLLGLLYPTRGRISLFGKPPTDVSVKARIGFLPEESYLYRFLGARETLDHFGRLFRLPGPIRKERIERLLDMVGLKHEARRPVGEFSKGMARRIGLATRADQRPGVSHPRRADLRPGPHRHAPDQGPRPRAGPAGQDHPALQPYSRRRRGRL